MTPPQGPWIYVHDLDPWVFQWGGHALSWYWLTYLLGHLFVFFFSLHLVKKTQTLRPYEIASFVQWGLPSMLISARLFYVLFYYPSFFWENPGMILQFWRGGMSFHGALLGPLLLAFYLARKNKRDIFCYLDPVAVALPFVLIFGRVANFINGELAGSPTQGSWGVIFAQYYDLQPRHPSQLYQALTEGLLLFIFLYWQRKKLRFPGFLSGLFLMGYGAMRFLTEFFREPDPQLGKIIGLNLGQWLCLVMIMGGLALYSSRKTRYSASKTSDF